MWEIYCNFVIQSEDDSHDNTDHNSLDSQLYIPSETKPLGIGRMYQAQPACGKGNPWGGLLGVIRLFIVGAIFFIAGVILIWRRGIRVGKEFPDTERGRLQDFFSEITSLPLFFVEPGGIEPPSKQVAKKFSTRLVFPFVFEPGQAKNLPTIGLILLCTATGRRRTCTRTDFDCFALQGKRAVNQGFFRKRR